MTHVQNNEKNYVIVGAGLAGLIAARLLQRNGAKNICVIEKSGTVGGLLQHQVVNSPLNDGRDFYFDFGTHFILSPSNGPLKKFITDDLNLDEFYSFDRSLLEGHVLNGKLYEQSGCASISNLENKHQNIVRQEIEQLHDKQVSNDNQNFNFYESCLNRYGETATNLIYAPAYQKFTGMGARDLPEEIGNYFAPGRIIIDGREQSIDLKKDADWDWRIAYADCRDSSSDISKYYPKDAGIGYWMEIIAAKLTEGGARILTETTVDSIEIDNEKVSNVRLSNGEILDCEKLIWSLPSIFLAKLADIAVPSMKPNMRQVMTCHYIIDKKSVDQPFWITVYDPEFISHRVTLYENYAPLYDDAYRITVEILHGGEYDERGDTDLQDRVFNELKAMEIIPQDTSKLWSNLHNKANGFPVLTKEQSDVISRQNEILQNTLSNIEIIGRRPDVGGGQISVMNYVWDILGKDGQPH